jgi:threonine synthase
MDIQVSSNFERLLFEAEGRDAGAVRRLMAGLEQSSAFTLNDRTRAALAEDFWSGVCDEAEAAATIARVRERTGELIDPHTAVGVSVANRHLGTVPMVTLATAHPAKFPEAVERAVGECPELPAWAKAVIAREERYDVLPADLRALEEAIEARSAAARVTV